MYGPDSSRAGGSGHGQSSLTEAPERLSLHRSIDAPVHRVFALITDPRRHVEIDGSGMLVASIDARKLTDVGDTFDMDMDREPLGDIPLGKYQVRNTVTKFETDRLLEWNVGARGDKPFGHVYGYELAPTANGTDVTFYVDWCGVAEKYKPYFPVVPKQMLEKSLDNLERLATES